MTHFGHVDGVRIGDIQQDATRSNVFRIAIKNHADHTVRFRNANLTRLKRRGVEKSIEHLPCFLEKFFRIDK